MFTDKLVFEGYFGRGEGYHMFVFDLHEDLRSEVNYGDQIYSDGYCVEILIGCDKEVLDNLICLTQNKDELIEALNKAGFI